MRDRPRRRSNQYNSVLSRKLSVSAIQSGILLLTTSNYRLMFVICFVVDVDFMVSLIAYYCF